MPTRRTKRNREDDDGEQKPLGALAATKKAFGRLMKKSDTHPSLSWVGNYMPLRSSPEYEVGFLKKEAMALITFLGYYHRTVDDDDYHRGCPVAFLTGVGGLCRKMPIYSFKGTAARASSIYYSVHKTKVDISRGWDMAKKTCDELASLGRADWDIKFLPRKEAHSFILGDNEEKLWRPSVKSRRFLFTCIIAEQNDVVKIYFDNCYLVHEMDQMRVLPWFREMLFEAVRCANFQALEIMLKSYTFKKPDETGVGQEFLDRCATAVITTAQFHHVKLLRLLTGVGAKLKTFTQEQRSQVRTLHKVASAKMIDVGRYILGDDDKLPDPLPIEDDDDLSCVKDLVHAAVLQGRLDDALWFIEKGNACYKNNSPGEGDGGGNDGEEWLLSSPQELYKLVRSCISTQPAQNSVSLLEYFHLQKGAPLESRNSPLAEREAPLMWQCVTKSNPYAARFLLLHPSPDVREQTTTTTATKTTSTPANEDLVEVETPFSPLPSLMYSAIEHGDLPLVKWFVEFGGEKSSPLFEQRAELLLHAIRMTAQLQDDAKKLELLRYFTEDLGGNTIITAAAPTKEDGDEREEDSKAAGGPIFVTPLELSIKCNNTVATHYLLQQGKENPLSPSSMQQHGGSDSDGGTSSHLNMISVAISYQSLEALECLLQWMKDELPKEKFSLRQLAKQAAAVVTGPGHKRLSAQAWLKENRLL